jgi:hypothetical protein
LKTDRLLSDGAFEFQMGLRRGGDGFFCNRSPDLLAERRRWLRDDPGRYSAIEPAGREALDELVAFARAMNPCLAADSLVALGEGWEPDFLVLRRDGDAEPFRLVAGCVCFPSHWDLREKMGAPVAAIHAPVPTLNATLGASIDTFLASLKPGAVWERWNWGLAATAELNNHPSRQLARLGAEATLDACWFRAEHQAFRLLPATGSVLFAIRIEIVALRELAADPAIAARLANALRTMPAEIARYKGLADAGGRLAELLSD